MGGSLIKCKTFVAKTPIFAPSLTLVYYRQQVPVTPSSLNSSAAFVLHIPSQECLLWYGQVWEFLIKIKGYYWIKVLNCNYKTRYSFNKSHELPLFSFSLEISRF